MKPKKRTKSPSMAELNRKLSKVTTQLEQMIETSTRTYEWICKHHHWPKAMVAETLEEFYERRKNVAIDREVEKKLKDVLTTMANRVSVTETKPSRPPGSEPSADGSARP